MTLVAHLPLQENSGSTAYDVRGSNDGTVNGATQGVEGLLGTSAYSFDGTDDYIIDSDFPVVEQAGLTYSAWVKFDTLSSDGYIISTQEDSGWGLDYIRYNNADNTFQVQIGDGNGSTGSIVNSTTSPSTGTWYHVVAVANANSSRLEIWLNGILEEENGNHTSRGNPAPPLDIGRAGGGSAYADATITDVRIYNHALSPSEIQYLYEVSNHSSWSSSKKSIQSNFSDISLSFSGVSLPVNTSGTVYLYEDSTGDGNVDTVNSLTLSDSQTEYSFTGFDGTSGNDVWVRIELSTSDITTTAELTEALTLESASLNITIDGEEVTEVTIDGEVVNSLTIDGTNIF